MGIPFNRCTQVAFVTAGCIYDQRVIPFPMANRYPCIGDRARLSRRAHIRRQRSHAIQISRQIPGTESTSLSGCDIVATAALYSSIALRGTPSDRTSLTVDRSYQPAELSGRVYFTEQLFPNGVRGGSCLPVEIRTPSRTAPCPCATQIALGSLVPPPADVSVFEEYSFHVEPS